MEFPDCRSAEEPTGQHSSEPNHERSLAQRVANGSQEAWEEFLLEYAPTILKSIRRQPVRDEDEVQSVFVNVLTYLHRSGLQTYRGEAALSTWLDHVVRSRAVDELRRRKGRSPSPRREAVWRGHVRDFYRELTEALEERRPDRRMETGDKYGDEYSDEYGTAEKLRVQIQKLPEIEREVILLKLRGVSAREIARRLSLKNSRKAYTVAASAIRKLRRSLLL